MYNLPLGQENMATLIAFIYKFNGDKLKYLAIYG